MPPRPTLRIAEIFPSLQGEGLRQGEPTIFVRFAGCTLRCDFCDTKYAWKGGREMSPGEVTEAVKGLRARFPAGWVSLTGGEPFLQNLRPLVRLLRKAGLKILKQVREETGLLIVTEAVDQESLKLVAEYADIIQIGARNMQNFSLLRCVGRTRKPVMLKRGMYATLDEWFMAAEYIMSEGNSQVILCERGVRTIGEHARNLLDLATIPAVRRESHLPIIADPSHAAGRRDLVAPLARAAVAAGADGLMIEVHHEPERAMSDGAQSLYPDQFQTLMEEIRTLRPGGW